MSTYDARLAALEKDVADTMQDIIYKLDQTNSAGTMTLGKVWVQEQDIKHIKCRLDGMDQRLDKIEATMTTKEDLKTEIASVRSDIKTEIASVKNDIATMENRILGAFKQLIAAVNPQY